MKIFLDKISKLKLIILFLCILMPFVSIKIHAATENLSLAGVASTPVLTKIEAPTSVDVNTSPVLLNLKALDQNGQVYAQPVIYSIVYQAAACTIDATTGVLTIPAETSFSNIVVAATDGTTTVTTDIILNKKAGIRIAIKSIVSTDNGWKVANALNPVIDKNYTTGFTSTTTTSGTSLYPVMKLDFGRLVNVTNIRIVGETWKVKNSNNFGITNDGVTISPPGDKNTSNVGIPSTNASLRYISAKEYAFSDFQTYLCNGIYYNPRNFYTEWGPYKIYEIEAYYNGSDVGQRMLRSISGPDSVLKQVNSPANVQYTGMDSTNKQFIGASSWSIVSGNTTGIVIDANGTLSVASSAAEGNITVRCTYDANNMVDKIVTILPVKNIVIRNVDAPKFVQIPSSGDANVDVKIVTYDTDGQVVPNGLTFNVQLPIGVTFNSVTQTLSISSSAVSSIVAIKVSVPSSPDYLFELSLYKRYSVFVNHTGSGVADNVILNDGLYDKYNTSSQVTVQLPFNKEIDTIRYGCDFTQPLTNLKIQTGLTIEGLTTIMEITDQVELAKKLKEISFSPTNCKYIRLIFDEPINLYEVETYSIQETFKTISGNDVIYIPTLKAGNYNYKVLGNSTTKKILASSLNWAIVSPVSNVSINSGTVTVSTNAGQGDLIIQALSDGHILSKTIQIKNGAALPGGTISSIVAPLYVYSPYLGESDYNKFQLQAKDISGNVIPNELIQWKVNEQIYGIDIDGSGTLSIGANIYDAKLGVTATKDGITIKIYIIVAGRYPGMPNVLMLSDSGATATAPSNAPALIDGNLTTNYDNSRTEKVISNTNYSVSVSLTTAYKIDNVKVYKGLSSDETLLGQEMVGMKYLGATVPLDVMGWNNFPTLVSRYKGPGDSLADYISYSCRTNGGIFKIYEIAAYASSMQIYDIRANTDTIVIDSSKAIDLQLSAYSVDGNLLKTLTYTNGETHQLIWSIISDPAQGISINSDTGLLSVSKNATETTVVVQALYFGLPVTKSIRVQKTEQLNDEISVDMDYDWLVKERISAENLDMITKKVTLYGVGFNNSTITWKTSNSAYITVDGEVKRPLRDNSFTVILTATITKGSITKTKSFECTVIPYPQMTDRSKISDEDFFGKYDSVNAFWIIESKLDYSMPELASVKEAVMSGDYEKAKEELLSYTKIKFPQDTNITGSQINIPAEKICRDIMSNLGTGVLTVGDKLDWYKFNLGTIPTTSPLTIILTGWTKDNTIAQFYTRDNSDKSKMPYIKISFKGGDILKIPVKYDSYVRAGIHRKDFYGNEPYMQVMDSGWPVDSDTRMAQMFFDIQAAGISSDKVIVSTELYLYGQNLFQAGNKQLLVSTTVTADWKDYTQLNEDATEAAKSVIDFSYYDGKYNAFSYNGLPGGFEWLFQPTADREELYNQMARGPYDMYQVSLAYGATKNDYYAYNGLRQIDDFLSDRGENPFYTRPFDAMYRIQRYMTVQSKFTDSYFYNKDINTALWKSIWYSADRTAYGYPYLDNVENMAIAENGQLSTIASTYKEFTGGYKWFSTVLTFFNGRIITSFNPDGGYVEGSSAYALGAVTTYLNVATEAIKSGVDLNESFKTLLHKAMYYISEVSLPNGLDVAFGDGNYPVTTNSSKPVTTTVDSNIITKAGDLFDDPYLFYIGSNGGIKGSIKPFWTSHFYPDTKRFFFRSDWTNNAMYAVTSLDAGGKGHGHPDDLSLSLFGFDNFLLAENGRYSYTASDPFTIMAYSSQNHNVLGRVVKNGDILQQQYSTDSKILSMISNNYLDFFSGKVGTNDYAVQGTTQYENIDYQRNIFMIKPNYLIVNDKAKDLNAKTTDNYRYDIMWHFLPNSNTTMDDTTQVVRTNFGSKANVKIVPVDTTAILSKESGNYYPQINTYVPNDRIVYSKSVVGDKTVTFDTIIYPIKAYDTVTDVVTSRIPTGVDTSVATAMKIDRTDKASETTSSKYTDYYYYSYETSPSQREYGDMKFDGRVSYISYFNNGITNLLDTIMLHGGTKLSKDGNTLVEAVAGKELNDLTIKYDNDTIRIDSTAIKNYNPAITLNTHLIASDLLQLKGLVITADRKISKLEVNGESVTFVQNGNLITLLPDYISVNLSNTTESHYILPTITTNLSVLDNAINYAVSVNMPEGTLVLNNSNWDGKLYCEISNPTIYPSEGAVTSVKIYGKKANGDKIKLNFATPIRINIDRHTTSNVYLVNNNKLLLQSTTLTSDDVEQVNNILLPGTAGKYIAQRQLTIWTKDCYELVIGKVDVGVGGGPVTGGPVVGLPGSPGASNPGGSVPTIPTTPTEEPNKETTKLNDIENSWAKDAIQSFANYTAKKNMILGDNNNFYPEQETTRAVFVALLVKAFYDEPKQSDDTSFIDTKDKWYAPYVTLGVQKRIVLGINDTEFGGDLDITREQVMVIIARYLGLDMNYRVETNLTDISTASDWAVPAIQQLVEMKILTGYIDNTIRPKDKITKAEAVVILDRVLKYQNKQ